MNHFDILEQSNYTTLSYFNAFYTHKCKYFFITYKNDKITAMSKLVKRMRQAFALFFSMFFIVAPTLASSQAYAAVCGEQTASGMPTFCSIGYHTEPTVNMSCPFPSACYQGSNPAPAECSWSVNSSGKPTYCWSFKESDPNMPLIKNSHLRFNCVNRGNINDCGGILAQMGMQTTGFNYQIVDPNTLPGNTQPGDCGPNCHFQCVSMDYNQANIRDFMMAQGVRQCLQTISAGAGAAGGIVAGLGAGFALVPLAAGNSLTMLGTVVTANAAELGLSGAAGKAALDQAKTCLATLNGTNGQSLLDWNGSVTSADGTQTYCNAKTTLTMNTAFNVIGNTTTPPTTNPDSPFSLCNQIPDATQKQSCQTCNSSNGGDETNIKAIWTSIGCIPTTSEGIVGSLVKLGLGIAGTAAVLMILAGGFMLSTSQGDTKRVGEAKELVTSAVIGLLFIIFSVTLLQFIGVKLFHIPGFGS